MKSKHFLLLLPFMLAACNDENKINCASEQSQSALINTIKSQALASISQQTMDYTDVTNQLKIKTLEKLKLTTSQITTVSDDPESMMKTCSSTVSMKVDPEHYTALSNFYTSHYARNMDKVLEDYTLEQKASVFTAKVNYTLQPGADDHSVAVRLDEHNAISSGTAFLSVLDITIPIIRQADMRAQQPQQDGQKQAATQQM